MAACYRDQRRMGQMIDQMKILASNLDELRAEINALRNTYLRNEEDLPHANDFKRNRSSEINILHKLRRYMKKVTNIYTLRKRQKRDKIRESYYPCTNMDPVLPTFLNCIIRTRKKENMLQIPTRIKYLRSQGNQTNEKIGSRHCITKRASASMHTENTNYHESLFTKDGNEQYNKIIFPKRNTTLVPHCSEISCELDFQIEKSIFSSGSNVNIFSDSYTLKNCPENTKVVLSNGNNKQSATKCTQTRIAKLGRKSKNFHFYSKRPNLCFSKIKNAVIEKRIIRNSNERTFTICREVNNTKNYPNLKKNHSERCSCRKKRNNFTQLNGENTSGQNFPIEKNTKKIKNNLSIKNMFENLLPVTKPELSSSLLSLELDINISNNSSNIEEFSERRKPRTYIIRQTTQECNRNNWLNNLEKSVVCVEQTSDLTLSSCSFSNQNVHFN